MNKIKSFIQRHTLLTVILFLALGLVLGLLIAKGSGDKSSDSTEGSSKKTIYTCSMDPSVRQDHPGKCPICGMDLIPLASNASSQSTPSDGVMLSDEALALANVETEVVGTGATGKQTRLFGKVAPDERLQQTQAAYVEGRIERLMINAVGDHVSKGQTLAVIYSPSLYTAEQELVAALNFPSGVQRKALIEAAVEKLRLQNITNAQIKKVIATKKASPYMELKANTSGTVVEKNVAQGDYVKQGQALLKIANLSTVWVVFQAYESDLPFIRTGATIHFTCEALPGKTFTGKVSFVDPVLDPKSRTAGVRVVMANGGGIFKPEMLATGILSLNMRQYNGDIVVPKSAILWTGKRSVVYVKEEEGGQPVFMLREVTLGPSLPDGYVITDGLAEGEEIVTRGAFAIDASAQLDGKPSMMDR